jgi:hypothetical protein
LGKEEERGQGQQSEKDEACSSFVHKVSPFAGAEAQII